MFGNFFGNLENHHVLIQTAVVNFWATSEKIGQLFIPTSGHTGCTYDGNISEMFTYSEHRIFWPQF